MDTFTPFEHSPSEHIVKNHERIASPATTHSRHLLLSGLAALLLSATVQARTLPPPDTQGIYLSSEASALETDGSNSVLTVITESEPLSSLLQDTTQPSSSVRSAPWSDDAAWITDIGTSLYHDEDRDGYYSSLSLIIDADTSRSYTEVYLTIDLQHHQGSRERLHTSNIFSIYGSSLSDEYQIDLDLLQNYPTGTYDLYIELHDAYDRDVLDWVNASNFNNLSALPLESEDRDHTYDPAPNEPQYTPANDDIYVTEYAGSAGLSMSLGLGLVLAARRRKAG